MTEINPPPRIGATCAYPHKRAGICERQNVYKFQSSSKSHRVKSLLVNMSTKTSASILNFVSSQLKKLVRSLLVSILLIGICVEMDLTSTKRMSYGIAAAAVDFYPGDFCTQFQSPLADALHGNLSFSQIGWAGEDYGLLQFANPAAVLYPAAESDIASVVNTVYTSDSCKTLTIAARGNSHSVRGQALALHGIVVDMASLASQINVNQADMYVEVGAGELWVDVLEACLTVGLSPRTFTDYLRLTVGGTLSNAGLSGQSHRWGPQINNVLLLRVITGTGETVTCTREVNSELFFAALGGLGQFGIITTARIALQPAPTQVKWIRLLYSDFLQFKQDQEFLISQAGNANAFNYIEGFVISNTADPANGYTSVPFPESGQVVNTDLLPSLESTTTLYFIELALNYDNDTDPKVVDEKVQTMLASLQYIPTQAFVTAVSYFDFLDRLHPTEEFLRSKGQWDVPHPWLNLFVPASKMLDFYREVFQPLSPDITNAGPIIVYALNRSKWDLRMSAQIPDEEVFYLVALLPSVVQNSSTPLITFVARNINITTFCTEIGGKMYLPHFSDIRDWKRHFGANWNQFVQNKMKFDPAGILAPGQNIFKRGQVP